MARNRRKFNSKIGKYIILFFTIALIITAIVGYRYYGYVFNKNVKNDYELIIDKETNYDDIVRQLETNDVLNNLNAFKWVAKKKNYPNNVKIGYYRLKKGLNTNQIVNKLRGGMQDPIKLTFNNIRFKEDLAGKISQYLLADSLSIINLFSNKALIEKYGFTSDNFKSMFIPNTYEIYWTTNAIEFAERMHKEYQKFWTDQRRKKAKAINLSPIEVSILASIVQAETAKKDEMKRVAGLYINRLKSGRHLQADPTVKFAIGDFSVKRILSHHLTVQSPYNTYMHVGLPPGPINFPEIFAIDAVLNFEKHNYFYMCAKEDFSGYHNFAKTLRQHNINAKKYHRELNKNKIWR